MEMLWFLTQDAMPADKNTVSHLVKALNSQENIGAAYARQLPNSSCSFVEAYTRSFNYPDQSGVKTKDDLPVLGIKTFSAPMYVLPTKKIFTGNWEDLWKKPFLMRT